MPRARKNKPPKAPPSETEPDTFSPLEGISEFFDEMSAKERELAAAVVAWSRHPLGASLDTAESAATRVTSASVNVDREKMERSLIEVLGAHPAAVHLVHSGKDLPGPAGKPGAPSWLVIVADRDDLEAALRELITGASQPEARTTGLRDVVIWTRKWDSEAWERASSKGLGTLEEKPFWVKLWDSSGSLLGPFRFLE